MTTLARFADEDGDFLKVEEAYADPSLRLFFATTDDGVFLDVSQIKELRKVLKQWLVEHGHKKGAQ